ncbi:MAG TPA: LON peptidase substrate-binding domain-containing protein [Bryobacteraceae bacterium]|jgi:Lon protease-like protein|nr:LON peptidase substrate-binding domain-containing protein [Bryobacteraceae bacterium]
MQQELLPLFPLPLVLFPGAPLPLHIFEDRYKEMFGEVMRERKEFGVVQAGEKGIVNTGCTAAVERVLKQYPDGRLDVLAQGRRRFEILLLNDERSFLRGAVDFFDDDDFKPVSEEAQKRALDGFAELRSLKSDDDIGEPDAADRQLSFRLAQPVADLEFRQLLLATRSEADRMKQVADYLQSYVSRERAVLHMRSAAPRNGHGKWPQNL